MARARRHGTCFGESEVGVVGKRNGADVAEEGASERTEAGRAAGDYNVRARARERLFGRRGGGGWWFVCTRAASLFFRACRGRRLLFVRLRRSGLPSRGGGGRSRGTGGTDETKHWSRQGWTWRRVSSPSRRLALARVVWGGERVRRDPREEGGGAGRQHEGRAMF